MLAEREEGLLSTINEETQMFVVITLSELILISILVVAIILYLGTTFIDYVVYQIKKRFKK
jgi:hypothetical protein